MSEKWIRASDIGDYAYCNRAWWLQRRQDIASANVQALERGTRGHELHGKRANRAHFLKRLSYALIALAAGALVYGLLAL